MAVGQTVGQPVTRQDIDEAMCQMALILRGVVARVTLDLAPWSATTPDADLEDAGKMNGPPYTTDQAYLIKATVDRLADVAAVLGGADPATAMPASRWPHDLAGDLAQMKGLAGA